MKYIMFIVLFGNLVFANYMYDNQGKGKIDMHGGKSDSLYNDKSSFSNSNFNTLGTFNKKNPTPLKKETIIKKDKKSK